MPFDALVSAVVDGRAEFENNLLSQMRNLHDQVDALAVMQDDMRGAVPLLLKDIDQAIAAFQGFADMIKEARTLTGAR
jgi:hypothetical protein